MWLPALLLGLAALGWWAYRTQVVATDPAPPSSLSSLIPGSIARMDSPLFVYTPGWQISATGADPGEPADPWNEPSGRISFTYSGRNLALQLAVGNYWGFLYVTVDGVAANQLPVIDNNRNHQGQVAGYKPLLAPEAQRANGPTPRWYSVHSAGDNGPHRVEIEVWRSWGQTPLRAVAVDAFPTLKPPLWPAWAFAVLALTVLALNLLPPLTHALGRTAQHVPGLPWRLPNRLLVPLTGLAILAIGGGVAFDSWIATDVGLALLALVGLHRPLLWGGALLWGLPFYLYPLPILPGRALNLVEIGIWGGLVLLAGHQLLCKTETVDQTQRRSRPTMSVLLTMPAFWLASLILLALIAALAADQQAVALREWRTLFLAGGGFALLLAWIRRGERAQRPLRLLFMFWLLGGLTIALVGIWQYAAGQMVIEAEGVDRVRAFYGSPNNLALYLERTAAVALALALFEKVDRRRTLVWWLLTIPQLAALLLTFSKGALLLALPATLIVLGMGGYFLLRHRQDPLRPLWGLVAVAGGMGLGLLPFLGAERFRSLADFSAGTTAGLRLNLWRSSLRMALDHPWLGVGPDNFLYAYRSGYILPAAWQDPDLNHPHNLILDWWTRLGLGGLLLGAGWLLNGARRLWRGLLEGDLAALRLGCLAAIAGALAHGAIDASYALPDLMIVWILLLGAGRYHSAEM